MAKIPPRRNDEARRQPGDEGKKSKLNPNDTSTENQRAIILAALQIAPRTTVELRHDFGIMQPAPRIHELINRFNYRIDSVRLTAVTPDGIKHPRVALYVLQPGGAV
ncbi:helix-turn-helix domain-containing protein [Sulfuriferula nivalis]|uniref:helix-turn-helix domain-containing protein n=1 Tax=Sulfuriferula nivalis TaxID=2675298 RepID=UPI001389F3CE|nr:helix-turn-helix domain-containing protein [Sulfuriferula nivalis]